MDFQPRASISVDNPKNFVLKNTATVTPTLVPEIRLNLADETCPIWEKTVPQLEVFCTSELFWAFAWAGGQALARYILDNPEIVSEQSVLDFGSGSGIVAIAAAKAGASQVIASDIDEYAAAAIEVNAKKNNVAVEVTQDNLIGCCGHWTTVLAAAVCYEKDMSLQVTDWLCSLADKGTKVFIGDAQRFYLPKNNLESVVKYSPPFLSPLEDTDLKNAQVWRVL